MQLLYLGLPRPPPDSLVPQEDTQDMQTYSWLWFIATEELKISTGKGHGGSLEEARHKLPGVSPQEFTQWACVLSCIRLFVTPGTVAWLAPRSMGFLQARMLKWVAIVSSTVHTGHTYFPQQWAVATDPKSCLPLTRYPEFLLGADHIDTLCRKGKVTQACPTLCDPMK